MGLSIYTFVYIIGNVFMTYVIYKYLRVFYTECRVSPLIERVCYLGYCAVISCIYVFFQIPVITLAANIALFFALTFLYAGSLKKSVLTTVIITISLMCIETIIVYFTSLFNQNPFLPFEYDSILGLIIIKIVSFAFVLGVHGFNNVKNERFIPNQYWICLITVPLCTVVMLVAVFLGRSVPDNMLAVCMVSALIINTLTFYLYDSIVNLLNEKMKKQLFEEQNKYYEQQILIMKSALDNYKLFRHDLKNRLTPLYGFAAAGDMQEVKAMLTELTEIYTQSSEYASSGNIAIDSIINFKLLEKSDIKVNVQILVPSDLAISTFDLAVILGNMLDNALEAVEKTVDKWINIRIKYSKGLIIIEVINSYDGYVNRSSSGFISRKKGKGKHGLGLKSIESIIQKYDGLMQIMHDEKQFKTKVLLYVMSKI